MKLEEFYTVLGLPLNLDERSQLIKAKDEEVKRAYKQKALQYHPDKNKDTNANQHFLLVKEAYERISNPASFIMEDNRRNNSSSSSSTSSPSSGGTVTYCKGVKVTSYSDGLREEMTTTKAGVENTNIFLNSTLIAIVKKTKKSITIQNVKGGCYEMSKQMPILYGFSIGPRGIINPNGSGGMSKASFEARQQENEKANEQARGAVASLASSLSDFLESLRRGSLGSSSASGGAAAAAAGAGSASASGSDSGGGARQSMMNQSSTQDFLKAACDGNVNRVESLFRNQPGIDKNARDHRGFTALYYAASNGHIKVAKFLVEVAKVDMNIASYGGQTPLWIAANHGRDEVALYLIEKGADIEKANGKFCTPLLSAADSGRNAVAKALVAKGANLDSANKWGQTSLFTAVQRNYPSVVKTLVESGADVNKSDYQGMTPLHTAVERGFVDIATYLMEKGKADLRARTNEIQTKHGRKIVDRKPGYLPMDLAQKCNRPDAMKQAILNEETRRRARDNVQGEEEQPAGKKQRLV